MPVGTKNNVIDGCGIHHIAIQTTDWDASIHLYRDVLGMQVVHEFGSPEQPITLLDVGDGSLIELFPPREDDSGEITSGVSLPIVHLALAAKDTRSAVEHIRASGYEITMEPKTLDLNSMHVTIAFFKGPNGEEFELFQTND